MQKYINALYNLYNLDKMPKQKVGGGAIQLSISVTAEEKAWLDKSGYSASKLFKMALKEKGFKSNKQE